MRKHKHQRAAEGLRGVFYGWDRLGGTTKATLYVGARTGLDTGPVPEGNVIPRGKVVRTIIGIRAEQIGPAAGATATVTQGRYKGKSEPSFKIEFFPDEPLPTFKRNIKRLAQEAARDLGQREIYVELIEGGKRTTTYSASPIGAPNPISQPTAFCAWVRKHSASARKPGDVCYRPTKGKR